MKIALAMIVKGDDKEAEVLSRCLKYAAPEVDGIFITITQHNDNVSKVAEAYGANISCYEWNNDFAQARNFNFSQVPKDYDYILWLDADDVPRGLDKLRKTIEKNPADVYSMFYLYAFDEYNNPIVVHLKTRVIKNDGCVEWAGKLHEDFKENRSLTRYTIKGIEILHLSNVERFEIAKKRNLEVAKEQLEQEPDDPRSYWNVANSLKALEQNEKALEMFEQFLKTSLSDDEKYIARLRMAECLWVMNKKTEALESAQYAIGLKPNFPDAYFLLGSLNFELGRYEKAQEMYLSGLTKPKPYHKIIVYNPRDYDYVPMMNLAKVYFALNRPDLALPLLEGCLKIQPKDKNLKKTIAEMKKEVAKFDKIVKLVKKLDKITDKSKLQKELDKIPQEVQSHPSICHIRNVNFIKETSSGRDLVIFCGYTREEWTPETAKQKGIGGSEEAVIWLSKIFAKNGWNVTVYNNCGHKELEFDGVKYKPFWAWNYRDKQDVVILWRTPHFVDYQINADKIIVDLHDVIPAGEFNELRLSRIDKIFVKSEYQRKLFPNIPDDKFIVVPNGIDPEKFTETKRDPKLIINTSAPDRSLSSLIQVAKKVKEKVPDAKFQWAYGWDVFTTAYEDNPKVLEWKQEIKKELLLAGIEELGRVSHDEVAKMYLSANVWLYPTGFAEIDCISLSKAMAGGSIPVTTDFAALGEKQGHGGFFYHSDTIKERWDKQVSHDFSLIDQEQIDAIASKVIDLINNPPLEDSRASMKAWAKNAYSWEKIGNQWLTYLYE